MTRAIRHAIVLATAAVGASVVMAAQAPMVTRTVLLRHDTSAAGFEAVLVAVEIPAAQREGRHTHPGTGIVHVTEGAITLDHEGKPSATYKAGESFFVDAGKVHEGINRGNVSAKAIATFVVPKGSQLTTQVASSPTK